MPGRTFGPPVLTLRPDLGGKRRRLHCYRHNYLKDKKENARELLEGAKRYASLKGKQLVNNKIPKNEEDLKNLVDELDRISDDIIQLYITKDEKIHLVAYHQINEDGIDYMIPIEPVLRYRPELKNLTLRFLNTIRVGFNLGDVRDMYPYEWSIDYMDEYLEEQKRDNPQYDKNEDEFYQNFIPYLPGGEAVKALDEFRQTQPVSRIEIESFKTETEDERKLIQAMLPFYDLLEKHFKIWDWEPYSYKVFEEDIDITDSIVSFAAICTIIYDYDRFMDNYFEYIDNDVNSGMDSPALVAMTEITKDYELPDTSDVTLFLGSSIEFYKAMIADSLAMKPTGEASR